MEAHKIIVNEYEVKPIFGNSDNIIQAKEVLALLKEGIIKLPKVPESQEDFWNWRNWFQNYWIYLYLNIQFILGEVLESRITDNSYQEKEGWFVYPRKYKIKLGGMTFNNVNEENTAIYTKYFDRCFSFPIKDKKIKLYFDEAMKAYKEKSYFACCCSLFPILEYFNRELSEYKGEGRFDYKKAFEIIVKKIPSITNFKDIRMEYLQNEYKKIKDFIVKNYYKPSSQNDEEPQFVSRHRIIHGILVRDINDADCLRLFHVIRSFSYIGCYFDLCKRFNQVGRQVMIFEDKAFLGKEEWVKMKQVMKNFNKEGYSLSGYGVKEKTS